MEIFDWTVPIAAAIVLVPVLIAKRSESEELFLQTGAGASSVALYFMAVMVTVFEKTASLTSVEAFGERPLGLPWQVFLPILLFVLAIPLPFLMYQLLRNALHLRTTKLGTTIGACCIVFYLLIGIAWISYAQWKGI